MTDETKNMIKENANIDDVMSYYGVLETAKRKKNPFRYDRKPGSFQKRKNSYVDYSETGDDGKPMRYTPTKVVSIMEDLDIHKDYFKILVKLAEICGIDIDDERNDRKWKNQIRTHVPTFEQKEMLGFVRNGEANGRAFMIKDISLFKPEGGEYISVANGYASGEYTEDFFRVIAENSQKELDNIIQNRSIEMFLKVKKMLKNLEVPDFEDDSCKKFWEDISEDGLDPVQLNNALVGLKREYYEIYKDFGGKKEEKELTWELLDMINLYYSLDQSPESKEKIALAKKRYEMSLKGVK